MYNTKAIHAMFSIIHVLHHTRRVSVLWSAKPMSLSFTPHRAECSEKVEEESRPQEFVNPTEHANEKPRDMQVFIHSYKVTRRYAEFYLVPVAN